jgi:predicted RNA-binding Zn-ribbon protein involved in translation (DUF1610 family)
MTYVITTLWKTPVIRQMRKEKSCIIDLSGITGNGDLNCPRCGVAMSPDDQSEDVYTVLHPVMKDGCLEKIVLRCNKCGSRIHLVGFEVLERLPPLARKRER